MLSDNGEKGASNSRSGEGIEDVVRVLESGMKGVNVMNGTVGLLKENDIKAVYQGEDMVGFGDATGGVTEKKSA